ncbi:MAG: hypothetical protein QME49_03490 [bacterium]|nr:hypothetical protein [bacterium]
MDLLMANAATIIIGIITILSIVVWVARQFKGIEKEIESTPPIRERLVMLEEKIKEVENLKNIVETIKERNWMMEGRLYSLEMKK